MVTKANETSETNEEPVEQSREVAVDSDALAQWTFTAPFEGIVPHLYLDTRGNVTCGVGFLVPNKEALDRYEWQPDVLTARGDYDRVRASAPAHAAAYYAGLCHATLTAATMRAHFDAHVTTVVAQIAQWRLDTVPRAARVALVDMAFNLGVGGLSKYVRLRTAVLARDWATAALECSRKGIQQSRNDATRDLFLSLVGLV
jgi:GH24 family phage-related lysozyme (muramidase)